MNRRYVTFLLAILVISGVSAIDAYLNLTYPVTEHCEENPIARWILQVTHGDLPLLISLKLLGTALVTSFLASLYFYKAALARFIALFLAVLQVFALTYIILA